MGAGQMGGAVQRHDGLACAGGAGNAGWSGVVVLHPLALFGVQEGQQLFVGRFGEEARLGRCGHFRLHIDRDNDLLHRFADFHQLRGPSLGMRLQPSPLGPVVGFVVVTHVAEQQAAFRLVNDEPDVAAHPH